jgi:protocatechuate 3,4-dioxygenase beta subunit
MAKIALFAFVMLAICRGASVEGQVTATTGEPLKNASVQLRQMVNRPSGVSRVAPQTNVYNASTDASGNFVIAAVEPGRYSVAAQRAGYFRWTASIELSAGQPPSIAIKLTPEARIEGRVTDQDGEPIRGNVGTVGWGTGQGGVPIAADGSYVIGGLGAGHFYLRVYPGPASETSGELRGTWPREIDVQTYYPGATAVDSATLLKVAPGAVIRGIDIRVRRATVYTVRGRAMNGTTGAPAADTYIGLSAGDDPNLQRIGAGATTLEDGTFEFDDVLPGTYRVRAAPRRVSGGSEPSPLFSLQPVTVGKENVEDLALRLTPGTEIDGKFVLEDNGRKALQSPYLPRVILIAIGGEGLGQGPAKSDGSFAIPDVAPRKAALTVDGLPPNTYVKSIDLNQQDVMNKEIDLSSGAGGTLEIVLSPHAAQVTGTIRNAAGDPLPQVRLTVWRPGRTTGGMAFQPAGRAVTDASGMFRVNNLAPGEYRIAAWAGAATIIPETPEFLSQFDGQAAALKLDEDARVTLSHETVEVPLISEEAIDAAMAIAG